MRSLFGTLVMFLVIILWGSYAWNHMRHTRLIAPAVPPRATTGDSPGSTSASPYESASDTATKFVGPLANYMQKQGSDSGQAGDGQDQVETLAAPLKPNPADRVGNSVVGSTMPVVQSTFRVRAAVQVPFQVPPHAATPRLKGSYQSFLKAGATDSESDANIEFLVLNEQQYVDFLAKRGGEAVFAAEDAQHQEVNAHFPPTLDRPQKYHLIFRNNSKGHEKKFVQADFHMEF